MPSRAVPEDAVSATDDAVPETPQPVDVEAPAEPEQAIGTGDILPTDVLPSDVEAPDAEGSPSSGRRVRARLARLATPRASTRASSLARVSLMFRSFRSSDFSSTP